MDHTYEVMVSTPMGDLPGKAVLNIAGNALNGMLSLLDHDNPFSGGRFGRTARSPSRVN